MRRPTIAVSAYRLRLALDVAQAIASGRARRGACPLCEVWGRRHAWFVQHGPSLRENTLCLRCRSNARNRAVMLTLTTELPDWRNASVFEGGGAGGPLSRALQEAGVDHIPSQMFPDVARGSTRGGVRSEDLQDLTLPSESVDIVITEDVFEHIWEPDRAFAEVARVLRRGGLHIFTVPFHADLARSRRRVAIDDGQLVHLEPPEYHEDPLDPAGVLVATDWGRDLPDLIEAACGMQTEIRAIVDPSRGIVEPCPLAISRKK